jgi:23S rRNA pseudouridine2605 synthase
VVAWPWLAAANVPLCPSGAGTYDGEAPARRNFLGNLAVSRNRRHKSEQQAGRRDGGDRLQKVLAAAGIGSRRECEELIVSGRVEVDGEPVTELGTRVDPQQQEIRVDGVSLPRPKRVYYVLNKPAGVVCTNRDPGGRVRAIDLVRSDERLFTVGRLDRTSEGLILVTNDGELANQLTHPRYGVEKRYLVRVAGSPDPSLYHKLRRGIHLAEGVARVSDIRVRKRSARFSDLEISLREGRNREIRRILARIGHKVLRLKRIAIGPLRLGMLPVGGTRPLTREEVRQLRQTTTHPGRHADRAQRTPPAPRHSKPLPSPPLAVPPPSVADEPDEVEVRDWEMERPTGKVLSFDDAPPPKPSAKRRRSR